MESAMYASGMRDAHNPFTGMSAAFTQGGAGGGTLDADQDLAQRLGQIGLESPSEQFESGGQTWTPGGS